LVEALPAGALRLGSEVERVEQSAERAELHLADGTRVETDAIVAADGMRSPIRQQLIGADEPVFSGTVVYRGLAPRERVLDLYSEPINRFWIGPYRHGPV